MNDTSFVIQRKYSVTNHKHHISDWEDIFSYPSRFDAELKMKSLRLSVDDVSSKFDYRIVEVKYV